MEKEKRADVSAECYDTFLPPEVSHQFCASFHHQQRQEKAIRTSSSAWTASPEAHQLPVELSVSYCTSTNSLTPLTHDPPPPPSPQLQGEGFTLVEFSALLQNLRLQSRSKDARFVLWNSQENSLFNKEKTRQEPVEQVPLCRHQEPSEGKTLKV